MKVGAMPKGGLKHLAIFGIAQHEREQYSADDDIIAKHVHIARDGSRCPPAEACKRAATMSQNANISRFVKHHVRPPSYIASTASRAKMLSIGKVAWLLYDPFAQDCPRCLAFPSMIVYPLKRRALRSTLEVFLKAVVRRR